MYWLALALTWGKTRRMGPLVNETDFVMYQLYYKCMAWHIYKDKDTRSHTEWILAKQTNKSNTAVMLSIFRGSYNGLITCIDVDRHMYVNMFSDQSLLFHQLGRMQHPLFDFILSQTTVHPLILCLYSLTLYLLKRIYLILCPGKLKDPFH